MVILQPQEGVDMENYRTEALRDDEVERYHKGGFLLAGKVISDITIEKLRATLDRLTSPVGTPNFPTVWPPAAGE
jgi:hypothetical protein